MATSNVFDDKFNDMVVWMFTLSIKRVENLFRERIATVLVKHDNFYT